MPRHDSAGDALRDSSIQAAIARGIIELSDTHVTYNIRQKKKYVWTDPEEWVRARTIAYLVVKKGYPANRLNTEVKVPRRTPSDWADIVVYRDDACQEPYIVVENKAAGQSAASRDQGIEQGFGNTNSLRAPMCLYDEYTRSNIYDVESYPPTERLRNLLGDRSRIPAQYGDVPTFRYISGQEGDISHVPANVLESKIRRAHSVIWSGGRRDPLTAFDEWSKLLFVKVVDEKTTPTGEARKFQVGTSETSATTATRIHRLFDIGCRDDPTVFPVDNRISLPDRKIVEVVEILQEVSFVRTDVDSIGLAFESFFGSVFRGELGQYFTMRQISRFAIALLELDHNDFVIDPTAGSGGFLLEALLQVWHDIDKRFAGQPELDIERRKIDFALQHVYGIEIHEILARICKINLLLHHDGHTHVEGDRSCLDSVFSLPRLNPPVRKFTCVVGNPPFGDEVEEGDEDLLGSNSLAAFEIAVGRRKVASEHAVIERSIDLLEWGGVLALVVPDGLLNNPGEQSNCPQMREFMARRGFFEAIVSLPDYAFRKSGAQNKTSLVFFRKFTEQQQRHFDSEIERLETEEGRRDVIFAAYARIDYRVFLAEASVIGYTPSGAPSETNDLYVPDEARNIAENQQGSILGEFREFKNDPNGYRDSSAPNTMAVQFTELWAAHSSNRLDPKYHLFRKEENSAAPKGWTRAPISTLMRRREDVIDPTTEPDRQFSVITIAQTGTLRPREAGKGKSPPEWRGSYFEDSPSTWYVARAGDVVFSSIDLWKGCISVVGDEFDGGLVTKEFPIYEVTNESIDPAFLSALLRSRYYQRAFRAITTGHSNRRRTQIGDFEALEIAFPESKYEQQRLIASLESARMQHRDAQRNLVAELDSFSDIIDGGHTVAPITHQNGGED